MKLNHQIWACFPREQAMKGYNLFRRGSVKLDYVLENDLLEMTGSVTDNVVYKAGVMIFPDIEELCCRCDCHAPDLCAHVAALLFAYRGEDTLPEGMTRNTVGAQLLLQKYNESVCVNARGSVKVYPKLKISGKSYDNEWASFLVGATRMYVIKDVRAFVNAFNVKDTVVYGKQLTLKHDYEALDERSARLVRCLTALMNAQDGYGKIADVRLEGHLLDEIFAMFLPDGQVDGYTLSESEPRLDLKIEKSEYDGQMGMRIAQTFKLLQGEHYRYLYLDRCLYRLTEDYERNVIPLLEAFRTTDISFEEKGIEAFCGMVYPRIRDRLQIEGSELLDDYLPESMTVRFYIDAPDRSCLTARAAFVYGEREIAADTRTRSLRRDTIGETRALNALAQHFDRKDDGQYALEDEKRIYDFLTGGSERLSEAGEVLISDRVRSLRVRRQQTAVIGVSVGESVLRLHVDTGEFPPEELEGLLEAVREKRSYYRLKDGRFLSAQDDDLSGIARVAHGLGLSAKELKQSEISLPLSRAMYLDGALKQEKKLEFERDDGFRRLIRDFRTVEDSDFHVPDSLTGVLRGYQKVGYRWLRTLDAYRFGGILADDMGLGKTLQVLAYLLALKQEGRADRPSLIVCPASLVLNWGAEAEKWTPELRVCLLGGTAAERRAQIQRANEFDLVVTSYDLLRRDGEAHAENEYYACVLDEAQFIKNHQTKGARTARELRANVRLALTGTPIENRLSELWSIFDFLMPGYLYKYEEFRRRIETPVAKNGDDEAAALLKKLIAPFILRRTKQEVLTELPPKTETVRVIPMEEAQRKLYMAYAWDVKKQVEESDGQEGRMRILAMLTRLRRLCCDPSLCVENYEGGSCKLEECVRMVTELTEGGHAALVFSQFTSMLARIRAALTAAGIASFTLQGDTPLKERAELVRRFNDGEVPVFLISLKAGGTGLNLTAADTVIHYDPWWNLAAQNQASDRCYRIGQTRRVQVYRLIAKDTIEENILKLQEKKSLLAELAAGDMNGGLLTMSCEDLMELLE